MQLKEEPEGFVMAVTKQNITKDLLMAMSALSAAKSRLDLIDHWPGFRLMDEYQDGIKKLIVEISQLQPPAAASPAPAGCASVPLNPLCPAPCSARR